jgi:protocatechuate 3,4-dioxygenase beta subunit
MRSLIRHLHAFVREVELTEEEWAAGIRFLTEVSQMCDENRQEFILLSDTLGVTALKDAINSPGGEGTTEASVLGPFYREGVPEVPHLYNIAGDVEGEPIVVSGTVGDSQGNPIAGALLDVWQATGEGFYDVQLDYLEGEAALRGRLHTDEEGRYSFRSVRPSSYPIPHDGPVGRMLERLGRHPYRPAHIHFIISAEGYEPVTTELYAAGDRYLDSDAVFGVRESLVVDFEKVDSAAEAARYGAGNPFYQVHYDFRLQRAEDGR